MIFSGSRSGRRRRRSCRARSPNSCSSAISASGGSLEHQAGRDRRDRDARAARRLRMNADQLSTSCGCTLRRCRMSSSISRRPADSAAISTRPWNSPRNARELARRLLAARIDAQARRRARVRSSDRAATASADRARRATARCVATPPGAASSSSAGMNTSAGVENRPLGVVAALLVAALRSRANACVGRSLARPSRRRRSCSPAGSRTASRSRRRTAAGSTRCPAAARLRRCRDRSPCA